jgi:hypothetical protein
MPVNDSSKRVSERQVSICSSTRIGVRMKGRARHTWMRKLAPLSGQNMPTAATSGSIRTDRVQARIDVRIPRDLS